MYITEKQGYDNRPVYILHKHENKLTQDAYNSGCRPYLERILEHEKNGGYFYTFAFDKPTAPDGNYYVYASRDFFTIYHQCKKQGEYELYNQVWQASPTQVKNTQRKNRVIFL